MRIVFCLTVAIVLFAAAAPARDIYVNNVSGDDRATGEVAESMAGLSGPVRTINKGIRLALPGDRIVVANTGVAYHESLSFDSEPQSGLALVGNGAILDGSIAVPEGAWEHYRSNVFRFRPARLGHQQLFLAGRPAVRRPTTSADFTIPALEPLEWCLSGGYIYFRVEEGKTPEAYEPSHAGLQTGITLYHATDVAIGDLIVQGFQLDGVNAHDGVRAGTLIGLTCRGNGRSGISVGGSSRLDIRECLVGDNGTAQVRTEGYSKTHVADCELIANTAPALVVKGGDVYVDGVKFDGDAP